MAVHVARGYAGTGKTEFVIQRISDTLGRRPLARIWVILATNRQEYAFRQRLIAANRHRPALFNIEFFDFYTLYQRLLDRSGQPQRLLSDASQLTLLRSLLLQHQSQLEHFHTIAHTPGFAKIVADFIFELKQNRIYPEAYWNAARTARDRDLAYIYAAYQAHLQAHHLVDKEGQGWLAVRALDNWPTLVDNLDLLVVDGFDQFTIVQSDLVSRLATRAANACLTLTEVPELQLTVGRRFAEAYEQLTVALGAVEVIDLDLEPAWKDCHADVIHAARNVFRYPAIARSSSAGIRFLEAPDEAQEVAAVFRHVKRLLLEGTPPDEILIVIRNWSPYQAHLAACQQKYKLPLTLHHGQQLGSNPAIIALTALLELHTTDFRRRDLLSVLRSPYFEIPTLDNDAVELLDRISLLFQVTSTQRRWFSAIDRASSLQADDDTDSTSISELPFGSWTPQDLESALSEFMAIVTPLDEDTPRGYVDWINALIGIDPAYPERLNHAEQGDDVEQAAAFTLNLVGCIRQAQTPDSILARDLQGVQAFKNLLHNMLAAHELVASLNDNPQQKITWNDFFAELQTLINTTELEQSTDRHGQVLVTTAANARGLPHDHVFILGLSEGGFPMPVAEDPLYLDQERAAMQIGGRPLLTRAQRASDDALFYELVSLARKSLTVSRPAQQEGTHRAASPFWRALTSLFSDAPHLIQQDRLRIGELPQLQDVATSDELTVVLASVLNRPAQTLAGDVVSAAAWLKESDPQLWAHVTHARQVEQQRLAGFSHYSGVLNHPRLVEVMGQMLAPSRVWSASQLNDYGLCGFRFFGKRILRLESLDEPEDGLDVAQRGQLIHTILERTYRELQLQSVSVTHENLDAALDLLYHHMDAVFAQPPDDIQFVADPLWAHEQAYIAGLLERFIRADFSDTSDNVLHKKFPYSDRVPFLLEESFGRDDGPVWLDLGSGVKIRIQGFIDRVDRIDDNQVVVIDYKTGSAPGIRELQDGRNFQMLIYLEGARALMQRRRVEKKVAGGVFWKLSGAEVVGALMPASDPKHDAYVQAAREQLANNIKQGRMGDFRTHPKKLENGRCIRYCEFSQLCRSRHGPKH